MPTILPAFALTNRRRALYARLAAAWSAADASPNRFTAAPYTQPAAWSSGVFYRSTAAVRGIGAAANRVYICTTPGTSSGTLGPLHATPATDAVESGGTVTWRYIGELTPARADAPAWQVVTDANILSAYPTLTQLISLNSGTSLLNTGRYTVGGAFPHVIAAESNKGINFRTVDTSLAGDNSNAERREASFSIFTDAPIVGYNVSFASQGAMRAVVEGVPVHHGSPNWGSTGGTSGEWVVYDFSSVAAGGRRLRRWDFDFASNQNIRAIRVGADDQVGPVGAWAPVRCMWIADSITTGAAGANPMPLSSGGWRTGLLLGWEVFQCGLGGTGYINPSGPNTNAENITARGVTPINPDVIVFQHGGNDSPTPQSDLAVAALRTWRNARAQAPHALIVVVAPFRSWANAATIAGGAWRHPLMQAAFAEFADPNSIYVDPVNGPEGAWQSGEFPSTGNAPFYAADAAHPSQPGLDYFSRRLNNAIRAGVRQKMLEAA